MGRGVLVVGGPEGVLEFRTLVGGPGPRATRHPLDGKPVTALAAGAQGRVVLAAQGRHLWLRRSGQWRRLPGPSGGLWRALAVHPHATARVLGATGRGIFIRRAEGGAFRAVAGPDLLEPVSLLRFVRCGGERGKDGIAVAAGSVVAWRRRGRRWRRLVLPLPVRALAASGAAGGGLLVAADRLYWWPCGASEAHPVSGALGVAPVSLAVTRTTEGAKGRHRTARAERLWLVAGGALLRADLRSAGPWLGAGSSRETGGRVVAGVARRAPRRRRSDLTEADSPCRYQSRQRAYKAIGRAAMVRLAARGRWLPAVSLRVQLWSQTRRVQWRAGSQGVAGRRSTRVAFAAMLTLSWPLGSLAASRILTWETAAQLLQRRRRRRALWARVAAAPALRGALQSSARLDKALPATLRRAATRLLAAAACRAQQPTEEPDERNSP